MSAVVDVKSRTQDMNTFVPFVHHRITIIGNTICEQKVKQNCSSLTSATLFIVDKIKEYDSYFVVGGRNIYVSK